MGHVSTFDIFLLYQENTGELEISLESIVVAISNLGKNFMSQRSCQVKVEIDFISESSGIILF